MEPLGPASITPTLTDTGPPAKGLTKPLAAS